MGVLEQGCVCPVCNVGLTQSGVGEVIRWTDGEREKLFFLFDTVGCPSEGLVKGWNSTSDGGCCKGRAFLPFLGRILARHYLFRTLAENYDFF